MIPGLTISLLLSLARASSFPCLPPPVLILQSVLSGKEKDILKDVPADRADEAKEVFADIKKG